MYPHLIDRFIKYVKVNTRSDEKSQTIPSTKSQVEFAQMLVQDLKEMGMSDVEYNDANGYVTATLPSNTDKQLPTIGFIAHMDTADFNAEDITPKFVENYDGADIVLNEEEQIVLSPTTFPNLKQYIGQTLITTDGTTLLGADDKAGIAEIMSAVDYMLNHPEIEHGKVRVAFGPDEEIGRGADHFDVDHFAADFAYTVDGGPVGELEYESFNAASAVVTIQGQNVHPGTAKNQMVNAITLGTAYNELLPAAEVPEQTEGREGFYHLLEFDGTVEEATLTYIIRDHDREKFEERKEIMIKNADVINQKVNSERVHVTVTDQYYNMAEVIKDDMRAVEVAEKAMKNIDITPIIKPIRGGTDGSIISFMGLPTPNIFAGGENFHGRYEYVPVESMEKATATIAEIIKTVAE